MQLEIISKDGSKRITHLTPEFFKATEVYNGKTRTKDLVTPQEKALSIALDSNNPFRVILTRGKKVMLNYIFGKKKKS